MKKQKLIILTGPTAVGKTKLSIALAKRIGGEIISADSMQVYQKMDIGSAKITNEEMEGVPHYLIDVLAPDEEFNVAVFQQLALEAIRTIEGHGHIPILVGGTAFYIQALLYGIDFTGEEQDKTYRNMLYEKSTEKDGIQTLYRLLQSKDPEYAGTLSANNVKRVVRALEYHHFTGEKFSEYNEKQRQKEAEYDFCYFVLSDERQRLYERINDRVDQMMQQGLLEEVKGLYEAGYGRELVSMQGLGYKELLAYFAGECTLEEAAEIIKRDTRHFAKRQLTWFRRERDVIWIPKNEYDYDERKILDVMIQNINAMEKRS